MRVNGKGDGKGRSGVEARERGSAWGACAWGCSARAGVSKGRGGWLGSTRAKAGWSLPHEWVSASVAWGDSDGGGRGGQGAWCEPSGPLLGWVGMSALDEFSRASLRHAAPFWPSLLPFPPLVFLREGGREGGWVCDGSPCGKERGGREGEGRLGTE